MKKTTVKKFIFLIAIFTSLGLIGCTKGTQKSIESKNTVLKVDKLSNETEKNLKENVNTTAESDETLKEVKEKSNTKNKKDNIKNTKIITQQRNKKDLNKDNEIFYGKWVIDSVLAWPHVGCYSDEDVKPILGKSVTYSKGFCEFKNNKLKNPYYKKEIVDNDKFIMLYKDPLSKLGIKKSKVTLIEVYKDSKYVSNWDTIASTLIVLDKDTLIIVDAGGAYFKAVRVR